MSSSGVSHHRLVLAAALGALLLAACDQSPIPNGPSFQEVPAAASADGRQEHLSMQDRYVVLFRPNEPDPWRHPSNIHRISNH
jgi:hypothetical protein